jgi:small subunit ribosomal protein S18
MEESVQGRRVGPLKSPLSGGARREPVRQVERGSHHSTSDRLGVGMAPLDLVSDEVADGDRGKDFEGQGPRSRRYSQISERNRCRFCRDKVTRVDYKDVLTLQKLCTSQGRIFSRKRSGNCAAHQRQVKRAIKQARHIGLMIYTT